MGWLHPYYMTILLFDTDQRTRLFPLAATRAVAHLRIGLYTLKERWQRLSGLEVNMLTDDYLQLLYQPFSPGEYLLVDATVKPTKTLLKKLLGRATGQALADESGLIGGRIQLSEQPVFNGNHQGYFQDISSSEAVERLLDFSRYFAWNEELLRTDIAELLSGSKSPGPTGDAQLIIPGAIYIEPGATLEHCYLNASDGPIYIGINATVLQGSMVRGPFALCEGAVLKMGAKVYGATTIGPYSTVGGEVKNSIVLCYSNKAHDGYLGDSIIGEWCNLGAGTTNSNLKNNVGQVSAWNYYENAFVAAGIKRGLIMGDFSRSAINTSFNTGTVVGVCSNVFGAGFAPKFIPDFSWGYDAQPYLFEKAVADVFSWMRLKNIQPDETIKKILKHIFDQRHVS